MGKCAVLRAETERGSVYQCWCSMRDVGDAVPTGIRTRSKLEPN